MHASHGGRFNRRLPDLQQHEPGANVMLFGTGNPDHLEHNIRAILQPPLPTVDVQKLAALFGALEGVGLDEANMKR